MNDLSGRMHNYTPEELLLYLYKESSAAQSLALEEELKSNWALREKLAVMKTAMERLNNIAVSPRTEAVLNVMRYAQEATAVKAASKS
ncbi:hypothetical protein [Flavisolibacter ginsenosidimutans]|nr:hypothetical protein [Flavisolibacter ginsenosidimutans]